jgi:hypothetical protein
VALEARWLNGSPPDYIAAAPWFESGLPQTTPNSLSSKAGWPPGGNKGTQKYIKILKVLEKKDNYEWKKLCTVCAIKKIQFVTYVLLPFSIFFFSNCCKFQVTL